jgi:hypothetical protein
MIVASAKPFWISSTAPPRRECPEADTSRITPSLDATTRLPKIIAQRAPPALPAIPPAEASLRAASLPARSPSDASLSLIESEGPITGDFGITASFQVGAICDAVTRALNGGAIIGGGVNAVSAVDSKGDAGGG